MGNIEYLYHYTNIETLTLILKNRTIRFNSLDKMDDLQEQQTSDLKNIGQFCYISSWTDDEAESIPMWDRYASLSIGVRIKLRKNPFKIYDNYPSDIAKVSKLNVIEESAGMPLKTIVPMTEMLSKGFMTPQAMSPDLLFKVEYTDDESKLYPKVVKVNGSQFSINLGALGIYKNPYWKFQNEWRYKIMFFPLDLNKPPAESFQDFQMIANEMLLDKAKQPFPYYDMVIDDDAFSDMQITLCPQISAGNRIIVESLLKAYNPTAELKESMLSGLI